MKNCGTKSVCVFLFICLSGCKTAPHRPTNVPASAVWVDGFFIECSIEEALRANRCTVYKDGSGEIQVSGLFHLSSAGREAKETELRYLTFDGTRIFLQDARTLYPVLLLEYVVPGMANQLGVLAGSDALNCGRVTLSEKPYAAFDCALRAFADKRPFHVSYDERGRGPGYSVGFAGDAAGNLYFVEYSNAGWPARPPSEEVRISDDNHIIFGLCPKPPRLFKAPTGELTCVGPIE